VVWGAISQRGATPLCIVDGTVNSTKYCEILSGFLLETAHVLYPVGWHFQQDDARRHTSAYTQAWRCKNTKLQQFRGQQLSQNISPIENKHMGTNEN